VAVGLALGPSMGIAFATAFRGQQTEETRR